MFDWFVLFLEKTTTETKFKLYDKLIYSLLFSMGFVRVSGGNQVELQQLID